MSLEKRALLCVVRGLVVAVVVGFLVSLATSRKVEPLGSMWTSESWANYCEEHYNK